MPHHRWAAATVALFGLAATDPAHARSFDIPPGPLGEVAARLGAQAGITIAVPDPDIAARRSPGVRGDFPVREALDRALQGTGAEAIFYDRTTVRLVRGRAVPKRPPRPKPAPPKAPAVQVDPTDIVVTASKQNVPLDSFPGSAKIVGLDSDWLARSAPGGTAAITAVLPTLNATNLGRGRNKIYVRGIADSSFNGPTQATVGQYLGDVRLSYNAPDPDLNLYDLDRVEVLAGPQGTLYGAGSIGGIVRLVPNGPDSSSAFASASVGVSATRFGGVGGDVAAMVNLPLAQGRMGLRVVAYGAREAGYIDDPGRKRRDINSGHNFGQRLIWRIDDVAGWTVDVGGVNQRIRSDDGQYLLRGEPPLERRNSLSQPFRNEYHLAYVTARRPMGRGELVSTSSVARQDLSTVFDATGTGAAAAPRRFEEQNDFTFWSHETRLSGGGAKTPWVAGLAAIHNVSRVSRWLGPPDAPEQIAGVRNRQLELSLFGQATLPVTRSLHLTMGGRLSMGRGAGRLVGDGSDGPEETSKRRAQFAATVALDWRLSPSLSIYSHYQEGFRAGGFAVAPAGSATGGQEFRSDELGQVELGVRWRDRDRDRLSLRAALFAVDWNNVQADLVDEGGLPYTANIGNGRIYGLDGEIQWRATPSLTLTAAAFLNQSFLYDVPPEFGEPNKNTLPNIPDDGLRLGVAWRTRLARNASLTVDASFRGFGKSNLGVGRLLDVSQGNYGVVGIGARLGFPRFGLSLDISNLRDTRANSFAFGNPFGLAGRNQITPVRPRTIRLGIDARF
ncbi:TonB-dependent receptor domain-containing protein [Sphingopyxis sp.]|uniref:TonB-dependent receptor domain-containing protein n=1 Tax=Sphingopyxis sp. TaxID=1908224 RepID=UPI003D6D9382